MVRKDANNFTMSKIGKSPVTILEGAKVEINGRSVKVLGPKGELTLTLPKEIEAKLNENQVELTRNGNSKQATALHGTYRSLINNMVRGVTLGWQKKLELVGTGFRAEVSGNTLSLTVGFSHPVKIEAPGGITFKVEKSIVTVDGVNREVVGQVAADIRGVRPPEPYKGKGIKYIDEVIRRKPGKAAAKTGPAA